MATLAETIKAASGLIAYWPLTDANDQSGNGYHLALHGTVTFGQISLTTSLAPAVLTPPSGGALRIEQATLPKIKAVEGMFRLAGAKGGGVYSTAIGINQPLSGFNNRYMLIYQDTLGFCSYQSQAPLGGNTTYPSQISDWDKLSWGSHHYVIQLNESGTATEVYIDGVKDPDMTVQFDIFLQTAGLYLTVGAYYYNGGAIGNGHCSDVAIYTRPLTQTEITDRQQYRALADFKLAPTGKPIPANQETLAQFRPQDVTWWSAPGHVYAGPMVMPGVSAYPLTQGLDLPWIRDGNQNVLQGYIENRVTINGEGVRRRVLCFTQFGDLVGETMSRASDGKYRFDLLWLNRRYMLVAQDDPAFGPADYNAVAADFQQPIAYAPGEGVGLTGA